MKYYKIEGIIESKNENLDLDDITYYLLENINEIGLSFGGGIKEVDSEGNEIKQ